MTMPSSPQATGMCIPNFPVEYLRTGDRPSDGFRLFDGYDHEIVCYLFSIHQNDAATGWTKGDNFLFWITGGGMARDTIPPIQSPFGYCS